MGTGERSRSDARGSRLGGDGSGSAGAGSDLRGDERTAAAGRESF
jgi:hypothetical protein